MDSQLLSLVGPVAMFGIAMSITPGPNNIMLTASGANFGFRRSIPHMLGICIGCLLLMVLMALGLGALFTSLPVLQTILKLTGSLYLLWLAYKIATSLPPTLNANNVEQQPMGFFPAVVFQFANPKAWLMAISGIASFTLAGDYFVESAILACVVISVVNLPSISLWAGFGVAIGKVLKTAQHWRYFNVIMGVLTASCVLMILS